MICPDEGFNTETLTEILKIYIHNDSVVAGISSKISSNSMKMAESSLKGVENTAGKEEIACYEQFLLLPQCFQKTCTADT